MRYIKAATWNYYVVCAIAGLIVVIIGVKWFKYSAPTLKSATRSSIVITARDGITPLRETQTTAHVDLKQLEDFGPYLGDAVIASEDSRYYWHFGVDPLLLLQPLTINARSGDVQQGTSTITQQVARILFRDYIRTQNSLGSPLREAVVSLKLETFYSKNDILLTYLNRVFLGANTYGFEDASRYYFDNQEVLGAKVLVVISLLFLHNLLMESKLFIL